MLFNADANTLAPERDRGGPKRLIDLNVVKKGANYASRRTKDQQKEDETQL